MTRVFVYGTLRAGECREGVLHNKAVRWEPAAILGFDIYDLGSFPCITYSAYGRQVFGELVECIDPEEVLHRLDGIEGYNPDRPQEQNLYVRREVDVILLANGRKEKAMAYIFANGERLADREPPLVESGNWRSSRKGKWGTFR